jgi:hypothetical protein
MRKQIKTKQKRIEDFIIFCDNDLDCHCVVGLLFNIRFNSRRCSSFVSAIISDKRSGYVSSNL